MREPKPCRDGRRAKQRLFDGLLSAQLSVTFYEGDAISPRVRQAKEKLAEAQFLMDQQRAQVRASFESYWAACLTGRWPDAPHYARSARDRVRAAETPLQGVQEEARLGQR
ncbi:TolC family protein [Methylocella sp.]|uniref:TolC family protein n=1 Tax=Methylocella sp. TaxID=1978226 RepID=UPI003C73C2CD